MDLEITLPDKIAQDLSSQWGHLESHVLEMIVVQAYQDQIISAGRMKELLGFGTWLEVDLFLESKGLKLRPDESEWDACPTNHSKVQAPGKCLA